MKRQITVFKFVTAILILIAAQFFAVRAQNADELYQAKKYDQVLKIIDAEIEKNKTEKALTNEGIKKRADLYFMRGAARVELIYAARTGTLLGSYAPIAPERATFEIDFKPLTLAALDGAIGDLAKAYDFYQKITLPQEAVKNVGADELGSNINRERETLKYQALAQLEKAEFVTNKQSDFEKVTELLEKRDNTVHPLYDDPKTRWLKDGYLLAAEIRAKVGRGYGLSSAYDRYNLWHLADYAYLKKEIALSSLVEAFDMTGNYARARAVLLVSAIQQIQKDGGKFVPENQKAIRAAARSHLYNVQFASQRKIDGKLLPFQRARLAGALYLRGKLSSAETDFIKNLDSALWTNDKELPPADTRIFVIQTKLSSGSEAEKAAALEAVERILKLDPYDVAARVARAYAKYQKNDFAGAETDLTTAIKTDPALAFIHQAQILRSAIYKKLGNTDSAVKDEQEVMQYQRLLGALAAQ